MLRSQNQKFGKAGVGIKFWKVEVGNFLMVGVGYFTSTPQTWLFVLITECWLNAREIDMSKKEGLTYFIEFFSTSVGFWMNHWINCHKQWNTLHEFLVVFRERCRFGKKTVWGGPAGQVRVKILWVQGRSRQNFSNWCGTDLKFLDVAWEQTKNFNTCRTLDYVA